jgi:RNA polymerase sigma-70 factor (ECF subfamily)
MRWDDFKGNKDLMAVNRSNDEWRRDLKTPGQAQEAALADLREIIARGLPYALSKWLSPSDPQFEALVEETVQETLVRVLSYLDTFEGRSKFTTWVHKIAVRIAISELRRKRWKDISLDDLLSENGFIEEFKIMASHDPGPEDSAEQSELLYQVKKIIAEELTEKQRNAIVAILIHGMPVDEVADRMEMKRNALYKLLHDARLRLKQRMAESGLTPSDVLDSFEVS